MSLTARSRSSTAFPDLPARRYPELAEEVRDRYGIGYHEGPLGQRLLSVATKICRLALPDRKSDLVPSFPRRPVAVPRTDAPWAT